MTRFELQTSGIGSERSTNWATTTAHVIVPTEVLCKQKTFRNTFEISAKVFELLLLHKRWNEAWRSILRNIWEGKKLCGDRDSNLRTFG